MKKLGFWLIVLGVGAFILPKIGLQFKIINLFGKYQGVAAAAFAVVGILMFLAGSLNKRGAVQPADNEQGVSNQNISIEK